MTYPPCPKCDPHPWHGLPCRSHNCGCPSPYDDDYWNEGDTQ